MTIKTLLATLALAVLPTFGLAAGCGHAASDQQAMSCAEGTLWDQTTGTCVPQTTS